MKIRPKEFKVKDYLGKTFECDCGHHHTTALQDVIIKPGAIKEVTSLLNKLGCHYPMIVCDRNTKAVEGDLINELLSADGIDTVFHLLDSSQVVPNESVLGELLMAHKPSVDLIIAVGTGTINDICKFLSFHMGLPYIIVATAPSMDGFASIGAALITENLKTTYDTHVPLAIVADVDILKKAPLEMITAGLGDILGKYTCLTDWKLANIINGEYYCPVIVEMVEESIARVTANAEKVLVRDEKAISAIMEALVLSGIAMSFVGNSRPASGSEHHISHYWEMKFLFEGKTPVLHGTKVGVGTVLSTYMYHQLKEKKPNFAKARDAIKRYDAAEWEKNIHRTFLQAAPGVIELEHRTAKNGIENHAKRIAVIEQRWDDIVEMISQNIPSTYQMIRLLESLGAPVYPIQVGVEKDLVYDSILVAKEVRDRYTILQLLWDLGLAEEMAEQINGWLAEQQTVTI